MTDNIYAKELIDTYIEAQKRIINKIGTSNVRTNKFLRSINVEINRLNRHSEFWAKTNIPKQYKREVEQAVNRYKKLGIETKSFKGNKNAHQIEVDMLVQNTVEKLTNANNFIGRRINDSIRRVSNQVIRQGILTGMNTRQIQREIKKRLISQNITSIKTANGRNLNIDSYAEVVARSTMTETKNRAMIKQVELSGNDLVKMSKHATSCHVCATLQGRVYSISGKSKIFPPLNKAFTGLYANIHPRCRHFLLPYVPAKDDNYKKTVKESNRSFDIDGRSKTAKKKYEKQQKENAERNRDKRQWERYKIVLGEEVHKTLTGFRKAKKSNSLRYKKMQNKFRSLKP